MTDSIRVAVRVRPFNKREKKLKCKNIITMSGKSTVIKNPSDRSKKTYTLDYSYDSFDYKSPTTANQEVLFKDIGVDIKKLMFKGYNSCLFAYGQTGSGKSYSMIGCDGEQRGLIPRICEEIFKKIESNTKKNVKYKVTVSMLEIYNERVRDLLVPPKKCPKGGLKVREHPKTGPYVQGLHKALVKSYKSIFKHLERGNKNKTVASTKMNATSSRAHTIFQITFKQEIKENKRKRTKHARINLVDLAGSERAAKTGASGARLKEGSCINLSLSNLGNCISALSKKAKGLKVFVPFRTSKLTYILRESLSGNSKTFMICAISPADNNYDESKSTLDYAKRAKKIKLKAVVNEDPSEKIIRTLKAEIMRLKHLITPSKKKHRDSKEIEKYKEELENVTDIVTEYSKTDDDLEKETEEAEKEMIDFIENTGLVDNAESFNRNEDPHLINLSEDPNENESLVYSLDPAVKLDYTVGKNEKCSIELGGLGMKDHHASFHVELETKKVWLVPVDGKTFVNGKGVIEKIELEHGSRVCFAENKFFKFINPKYKGEEDSNVLDYDDAFMELAEEMAKEIEEKMESSIINLIPLINEANLLSNECKRNMEFEITFVEENDDKIPAVKVVDENSGWNAVWDIKMFKERLHGMRDFYSSKIDSTKEVTKAKNDDESDDEDDDPFFDVDAAQKFSKNNKKLRKKIKKRIRKVEKIDQNDFVKGMQTHIDKLKELNKEKDEKLLLLRKKLGQEIREDEQQEELFEDLEEENETLRNEKLQLENSSKSQEEEEVQKDKQIEELTNTLTILQERLFQSENHQTTLSQKQKELEIENKENKEVIKKFVSLVEKHKEKELKEKRIDELKSHVNSEVVNIKNKEIDAQKVLNAKLKRENKNLKERKTFCVIQ